MTRNGKIARLPQAIREQINRRLQNGDEGRQITAWLNSLPEVAALMTAEFDGQSINETNLSNWKLGGYRDWQSEQNARHALSRFSEQAVEFNKVGEANITEKLSVVAAAQLAYEWLHRPYGQEEDHDTRMARLRQFSLNITALRRQDQNDQWMKLKRQKHAFEIKKLAVYLANRLQPSAEATKNPGEPAVSKDSRSQTEDSLPFQPIKVNQGGSS